MLIRKIVPCLDTRDGRLVKGVKFVDIVDVGDPAEAAARYDQDGADELVLYDITSALEERRIFDELIRRVLERISIPLAVGGGISTLSDFEHVISLGAAKVSINSGAIKNPGLIEEAAKKFGSERVVLSTDVMRVGSSYHVFADGGRADTGIDALEWVRKGQENGAGELVINSISGDGARVGFDIELLKAVRDVSSLPIVASGGAGCMEHFLELFRKTDIETGLAASIFHFGDVRINELKKFLAKNGVKVVSK